GQRRRQSHKRGVAKTNNSFSERLRPDVFLSKFGSLIQGALAGFDRLFLRGTLRRLYRPNVDGGLQRVQRLYQVFWQVHRMQSGHNSTIY
ncbi:MAG: hypothetical protein ACXW32_16675, partial [Limisphaerales bacterium]